VHFSPPHESRRRRRPGKNSSPLLNPEPAVTSFYTSRREFLSGSLGMLSAAATAPLFLNAAVSALAQNSPAPTSRRNDSDPILVVIQLAGGNDGLNTVIPYEADPYYQLRPRLAIPKDRVLRLKNGFGLHPNCTALKDLFDAGRMAIVHGVGYPNPNRSHFVSMDIWHAGDAPGRRHSGWLGRYFDAQYKGSDPPPEPIRAIALMTESPLALQGDKFAPLSFRNADALQRRGPRNDPAAEEAFEQLNNIDGRFSEVGSPVAQFLQRAALQAQLGADDIREATGHSSRRRRAGARRTGDEPRRGGNSALHQQLQSVAGMIAANLPTRVYYLSHGGFDTHSGQLGPHGNLLTQFGEAVKAFLDRLAADGLLDRVLVLTFSEFGRRVQENASGGTDHGEAAPVFLFGSRVRPGLHGEFPDLRRLNRGDLAHTVDFRRIYASILRDWLKVPPAPILGPSFGPLAVINTR
jgi:uncharacterized protein (DUF1501 family)